ncbi:Protein of unknown function [Bacillus cytotoxicus]|nr:Protein of unknown function [Bacillus cytotoxicus]
MKMVRDDQLELVKGLAVFMMIFDPLV